MHKYWKDIYYNGWKEELEMRSDILRRRLSKIEWIKDNPGTQLTSSINPIFESPVDWYTDKYYDPFRLGLKPGVVGTFLKGINDTSSTLNMLIGQHELIKMILTHLFLSDFS